MGEVGRISEGDVRGEVDVLVFHPELQPCGRVFDPVVGVSRPAITLKPIAVPLVSEIGDGLESSFVLAAGIPPHSIDVVPVTSFFFKALHIVNGMNFCTGLLPVSRLEIVYIIIYCLHMVVLVVLD